MAYTGSVYLSWCQSLKSARVWVCEAALPGSGTLTQWPLHPHTVKSWGEHSLGFHMHPIHEEDFTFGPNHLPKATSSDIALGVRISLYEFGETHWGRAPSAHWPGVHWGGDLALPPLNLYSTFLNQRAAPPPLFPHPTDAQIPNQLPAVTVSFIVILLWGSIWQKGRSGNSRWWSG